MNSKLFEISVFKFDVVKLECIFSKSKCVASSWSQVLKVAPMRVEIVGAVVLALDAQK